MSEMTYRDVVRILELIDTSDCLDLNLHLGDLKLKVTRSRGPVPARSLQAESQSELPIGTEKVPSSLQGSDGVHPGATPIYAPMGGVFYASPAPGEPPFVSEGQEVKAGDQVGIVEVMKLFTAVTAPCDGTVVSILVDNHDAIKKDDTLMLLEVQA